LKNAKQLKNNEAIGGWELDHIDTVTSAQNPSCLRGYLEVVVK